MVFNATFNNISVISWRSVLLVEETGAPDENQRPVVSHWQTLSHNVVHLALIEIRTHNISGDKHWSGEDPGFQVRGAHLKKLRRAEGGAKNFGYFVWKITILRQKIIFFPILGGVRAGCAPPGSAPADCTVHLIA